MKELIIFLEMVRILNPKMTCGQAGRIFNVWRLNKRERVA